MFPPVETGIHFKGRGFIVMEKQPEKKVVGIIAIVFGAITLVTSWMPFVNNASFVLAIIGLIIALIALVMNRKNKKVLSLVGIGLAVISMVIVLVTQGMYSRTVDEAFDNASKATKASGHSTTSTEKGSKKDSKKTVEMGYKKYDVSSSKDYHVTYANTDWSAASVKVSKVVVNKLDDTYEYDTYTDGKKNINGIVTMHFEIKANQDITIYPSHGTAILNNSEQQDATGGSWDGEIANGVTKTGVVHIPVESLDSDDALQSIRFKFDGYYDTDDYSDANSHHEYDFTLDLK